MSDSNTINYGVYIASTPAGEKCSVNVRPSLGLPYQRRAAKLALQNAEPPLGTPQPVFEGVEGGVVWRTIAAITETRFLQNNLTPQQLDRARNVVIESVQNDGLSAIAIGGIIITETGLL